MILLTSFTTAVNVWYCSVPAVQCIDEFI